MEFPPLRWLFVLGLILRTKLGFVDTAQTLPLSPIIDSLGTIFIQSHLLITALHQLRTSVITSRPQELVLRLFWVSII